MIQCVEYGESHLCFSTKITPHLGLFIDRTFQEPYTGTGDPQKYFCPGSRELMLNHSREMCLCPFEDICCLPTPLIYGLWHI